MKLDPRLAEILGRQPKEEQTLAEKRARQNDVAARLRGKITPAVPDSVILEDRTVPGRTHPIPVLIQRPTPLQYWYGPTAGLLFTVPHAPCSPAQPASPSERGYVSSVSITDCCPSTTTPRTYMMSLTSCGG